MKKRKRLIKIRSLEKARDEHLKKIKEYKGPEYTLKPYWKKEVKGLEEQIQKEKKKLEKS